MMKKIFILLLLLFISLTSFSQRAAEFKNGITIQKEEVLASKFVSYGESYIENWGKSMLDLGATYFPNNGGYEIGRLHQAEINTSLHFIPAAVGEGVIYSVGKNRVNDLDVSNSASTYVDEDGIIQTAAIDFARIDYTDGDGAFLFEPQSTNLGFWSEDLSEWLNILVTITTNDIISPDGTLNADKFEFTGAGNIRVPNQVTFVDDYVYSCFIHKGNSRYVTIISDFFDTSIEVGFDLDLVTAETNGVIEEYVNGWFRLSISANVTGDADKTGVFNIHLPNSLGSTVSVSGNYAYLWGSQAEEGTIATSYIKTEGTTETRLADVITGAGDVNTFNSTEGVLYVEMSAESGGGTISLSDGTLSDRVIIFQSGSTWTARLTSGSSNSGTIEAITTNDFFKIAVKWDSSNFSVFVNGSFVETKPQVSAFSDDLDELRLDGATGSNNFYGKVKSIKVFNRALSDSELELLTKMFGFMFLCRIRRKETEFKIAA